MDYRFPLGAAAVALVLLPLGWQLYSSTSMTPPLTDVVSEDRSRDVDLVTPTEEPLSGKDERTEVTTAPTGETAPTDQTEVIPTNETEVATTTETGEVDDGTTTPVTELIETEVATTDGRAQAIDETTALVDAPIEQLPRTVDTAPSGETLGGMIDTETAKLAEDSTSDALALGGDADVAMSPDAAGTVAPPMTLDAGVATMESFAEPMVSPLPEQPGMGEVLQSGDEFTTFEESPLKLVADEPVSTFSIDVDTASYSYVRRMLIDGFVPEPDAVRIEEMVNYFPYDYPAAETAETPFKATMTVYPTPWNDKTQLLHIGIEGYVPPVTEDVANNLVFLIDTSGSMDEPNKLPLLKRSFELLVDQMGANDTISIVVYAGSAGVVLEPTKATDKIKIISALDNLWAGGSTAGAEGIELAYDLAQQNFVADGNNRVILATDGDFNIGISDPTQLIDFVKEKRETGVFLSVLGFGLGNYQDDTMQALAQNGNGNAAYIDTFQEAQKVLVEEAGSTLVTIATDVKIQIEFNPAFVSEYRLIGYETRALNREDFNNDRVDAGDIGAGHTVTAIYEITPAGVSSQFDPLRFGEDETTTPTTLDPTTSDEIAYLKLRYKAPGSDTSQLIEVPVTADLVLDDISKASEDVRFATAVAAFAQKLKDSNFIDLSWDTILDLAQGARGADEHGYRAEFVQLVRLASNLI